MGEGTEQQHGSAKIEAKGSVQRMCRRRLYGQALSITTVLLAFRMRLIKVNSPWLRALWPYISACFINEIVVLSLTGEESEQLRN